MLPKGTRHQDPLLFKGHGPKAEEKDARMERATGIDQLAEVEVVCHEQGLVPYSPRENVFVADAGCQRGDVHHIVPIRHEPLGDPTVEILVSKDVQPAAAETTRSERSASIA